MTHGFTRMVVGAALLAGGVFPALAQGKMVTLADVTRGGGGGQHLGQRYGGEPPAGGAQRRGERPGGVDRRVRQPGQQGG